MKIPYLSLFLLALCAFSCKKKDTETKKSTTCGIASITDTYASGDIIQTIISFEDGKIRKLINTAGLTREFFYKGDTIIIHTQNQNTIERDSILLENGLISLLYSDYNAKDKKFSRRTAFSYHSDSLLRHVTTDRLIGLSYRAEALAYFRWENGNLKSDDSSEYGYDTTLATSEGDYFSLSQMLRYGVKYIKNKNASVFRYQPQYNRRMLFKYTIDDIKRITKMQNYTQQNGREEYLQTSTYSYNCK